MLNALKNLGKNSPVSMLKVIECSSIAEAIGIPFGMGMTMRNADRRETQFHFYAYVLARISSSDGEADCWVIGSVIYNGQQSMKSELLTFLYYYNLASATDRCIQY